MWERYAIGRLVAGKMEEKGIDRKELVRLLGYKDFSKGLRKIDLAMKGEGKNNDILERIGELLDIPPHQLRSALSETRNRQVQSIIESIIPKVKR